MSNFKHESDLESDLENNLNGGPTLAGGEERTGVGLIVPKGVASSNNLGNKAAVVARAEDAVASEKQNLKEDLEFALSPEQQEIADGLREQVKVSFSSYGKVNAWLGLEAGEMGNEEEVTAHLEDQIDKWAEAGDLDYVAEVIAKQGGQEFRVVVTANQVVEKESLKDAYRAFGKDQPHETYLWEDQIDKYGKTELSGKPEKNGLPFRILLVPTKCTEESFDIEQAGESLKEEREKSDVVRDLTPLEGLYLTELMREEFKDEHGESVFKGNQGNGYGYIRYSSLPVRGGCVLGSFVSDDGRLHLGDSDASYRSGARRAVGER